MAITVIDAMNGMGQDWECSEVLRAEVRRLRAALAAAEQRATDAEARAERLAVALEPFARYARILDDETGFKHEDYYHMLTINPYYREAIVTMAHLRAARTALDDTRDDEEAEEA